MLVIQKKIEKTKKEIEELTRDLHYVKNDVTVGVIKFAIEFREVQLKDYNERYKLQKEAKRLYCNRNGE